MGLELRFAINAAVWVVGDRERDGGGGLGASLSSVLAIGSGSGAGSGRFTRLGLTGLRVLSAFLRFQGLFDGPPASLALPDSSAARASSQTGWAITVA